MRRGFVAFTALTLVGLGLTGCGLYRYEQREAWRNEAEQACLSQKLAQPSDYMALGSSIDGPGACGMNYPFKVAAFQDGTVGLSQRATLACPMISRTDAWLSEIVQPAASIYFGTSVVELKSGSYSCRSRNNQRGAKLSEHGFGNAVDVMAFRLADGREVTVVRGWRGSPDEQDFLREVFVGACGYFSTVLGPGSDQFHYDHFHLDLARHDPRGTRRVCKPVIKFTPRAESASPSRVRPPAEGWQPTDLPPIDIDEDSDPFAVESKNRRSPAPAHASAVPARTAQPSHPAYNRPPPPSAAAYPQAYVPPAPAQRQPSGPAWPMRESMQPPVWTGQGIY